MFRFTIRDVLWLTVVVALAVVWGLERQRSAGLARQVRVVETEAVNALAAVKCLHEDIDRIEQALPTHGLALVWSNEMRPRVQTMSPAVSAAPQ